MPYLFLTLAIGAELLATSLLKTTEGFTRLLPTLGCLTLYAVSFFGLAQAVKVIPVGVAYAMWSGLGTAAIVAIGVAFLGEPLSLVKVVGVALIIAGVVIINLGGGAHEAVGPMTGVIDIIDIPEHEV
ncbi:multidrug efflux SMR transporter [Rothia terrae]|uniref:Multidrug efflux SMR transporter n=1 Tax=Rothia terrae TaxID=396015 RepID=A0A7H2BFD7_9MICC|nr:multidrug efflux SMR transporter [Rothia terrae]NKZ34510.1 multidrug efflux SMR transporter [Rothia terrae]QNV38383.1 multidrug efflux SMR transporter [Rothia terrae]